ncbi:MAG: MFS transporter [Elusimicrobia bacterium RIFCSPLOWO2_12_FULL_59_9]|nr:MAG: MFS transporter [Elusimicrobia bacterium RIFCSPLOWO2_12_FULL_59_9]
MKFPTAIPRGVWVLGFVSLFMDVSSELIHSLLPVFMVSALGASAVAVGLVEGIAESTALIVKVFSGALSDYLGKRKELAVFGYGLGALSKPFFALAGSVEAVFAARFMDRVGKGLRGAPRDALIADLTPEPVRGAAYGLRQSLDTVGAFVGPLLAMALMLTFSGNFRTVFWFAAIPGVISVGLLVAGVRESEAVPSPGRVRTPIEWRMLKKLGGDYWMLVAGGAVFSLARFSEAFLILRARQAGLSDALAPSVLVLMNIVYALSAYPAGRLADRVDRRFLLGLGLAALLASDLALAQTGGWIPAAFGVALWGLHLGFTQGVFAAMLAAAAPANLRGTAFGFFNLASGIALLAASALAGLLWDKIGAPATFYAGAIFSAAALALVIAAIGRAPEAAASTG